MSLSRLQSVLQSRRHHASAFLMLGDPDPGRCLALTQAAVEEGASMLELGLPFSDPCADGPAIQAACKRAQDAGVDTAAAIACLAQIHAHLPEVPLNLLVYANLVHAPGPMEFCRQVAAAGASSLLVPDIPLEEARELREACTAQNLGHVHMLAPGTPPDRLHEIDVQSSGFLYLAAQQSVTGAASANAGRAELIRQVRARVRLPLCVGFGLSAARDLDEIFDAGAEIAVVGSHLARRIGQSLSEAPDRLLEDFRSVWRPLAACARRQATT